MLRGAWRASPDAAELADLGEAAPLLLRGGSGGLAWWRTRRLTGSDSILEPLHQAFRLHALQAALHEQKIPAAVTRLRERGIEPVLGKGWAVARLYPRPGLRPYGDVDLYVGPEAAAAARRALQAPPAPGAAVDLHGGFAELDDRPPAELFARSQVAALRDCAVRVFGPEDHLRLLALHFMRHGAWRPVWLCDLALLLEARPLEFDWGYFVAGDASRTEAAVVALRLAHELLGARVGGLPAPLEKRVLPGWLVPAVLRQWGQADFAPHGTRTPMAAELRRPWGLLRALRMRWPNPVEATVGRRGRFDDRPRLPFQIRECLSRTLQFVRAPGDAAPGPERAAER